MTAYDPSQWTDLFVATSGASAALAGLVFVAVSINVSVVGLIRGQSSGAFGTELLFVSLAVVLAIYRLPAIGSASFAAPRSRVWTRWGVRIAGTAVTPVAAKTRE